MTGTLGQLWPAKLTSIVMTASDPSEAAGYWAELLGASTNGDGVEFADGTRIAVREGAAQGLHAICFDATQPIVHAAGDLGATEDPAGHLALTDPNGWRLRFREVEHVAPIGSGQAMLSHCTLNSPDPNSQRAFYEQLHFRLSDALGDVFSWLRCNPIHHAIAFARHSDVSIHHLAIELPDREAFIAGIDRVVANGCVLEFGPGRHMVGGNLFAYLRDRYGLRWELCCEMGRIEDLAYVPAQLSEHDRARSVNLFGPPPPPSFIHESGGAGPVHVA